MPAVGKVTSNGMRISDAVRSDILNARWAPGGKLQPATLADLYQTSTTVIREALTLLAGDGLVSIKPNRGFFVPELDLRELQDLTELRCITEALASKLAIERGDSTWETDLVSAHYRLAKIPRHTSEDSTYLSEEWVAAHRSFHEALLRASGSTVINHLASNLADHTALYRRWAALSAVSAKRDIEAEHQAILDAALARDAFRTASLLRAHYEETVNVVLEAGLAHESKSPRH